MGKNNAGRDGEYDVIILGAGAAGLFAGASFPRPVRGLILEKGNAPGRKLLLTGAGQCNLTHSGDIKEFPSHYGEAGGRIRPILYRFNNRAVQDFFRRLGVALVEREDGKVFPASLRAADIRDALVGACRSNGFEFRFDAGAERIAAVSAPADPKASPADPKAQSCAGYIVAAAGATFRARKLIVATGGCSYPATGSDGSLFPLLEGLGLSVVPPRPALVPIHPAGYPYKELAGIGLEEVTVSVTDGRPLASRTGPLLFTHTGFSGPAILALSRKAAPGQILSIDYGPERKRADWEAAFRAAFPGDARQLVTVLKEKVDRPKRFFELLCRRAGLDPAAKASTLSGADCAILARQLTGDEFTIERTGGWHIAMTTAGGVSLDEIDTKTMEVRKQPGLYLAGEMLDVDGDTGGYNLQFAFSSARTAALAAAAALETSGVAAPAKKTVIKKETV